jgi:hypothetical protein
MTKISFIRVSFLTVCVALAAIVFANSRQVSQAIAADEPIAVAAPSHQVFACYFHRTVRCPTCKKISAYIDESVQAGFAAQVKDGSVKMIMVDFQDAKNQKLTQAYKITGPTLVIMDVRNGDVVSWKPAPKVWSLVAKKNDFYKYVQEEIRTYLDGKKTASK